MAEDAFRNRGLSVVVDTTKQAEFDFASHGLSERQLTDVASGLKAVPFSENDRCVGSIQIRTVLDDREVAYLITQDGSEVVLLVIGLDLLGELESRFSQLARGAMASMHPSVVELLKGRRRKR